MSAPQQPSEGQRPGEPTDRHDAQQGRPDPAGHAAPGSQAPPPGYAAPAQPPAGYAVPGHPVYAYPPDPPGKTMGIVGFVLAFVFAPAGIPVSAIAVSDSKKVGYDNVLGTWGLWLSIIFTALWLLAVVAYVLFLVGMFAMVATTSELSTV